jgi:formylglycine-generating enzyme required for sulfatase activity
MGLDKKSFLVLTFGVSMRIACMVALLAITSGCFRPLRTEFPDGEVGGSGGGGVGGTGGVGGASNSATDAGADRQADADGANCSSGTKLCDGKCIPATACCGPCSCDGLPHTCGPNQDEDCCASVLVTGGIFNRDNDPTYPAAISDFHLDRFEITVGRFNRFIAAGQGLQATAPQSGSGKNANDPNNDTGWDPGWNTYLATTSQGFATSVQCGSATYLSGDDLLPMNCITWYEAYAFCIWDGGRLPTEAEWIYAAAGGGAADGQRVYPWSAPPSSETVDITYSVNSVKGPARVGSRSPKGDGKWRQADLVGNVGEWVADYVGAYPVPCTNCTNRVVSERRVARGGDWNLPALEINASRAQLTLDWREGAYGARCARR